MGFSPASNRREFVVILQVLFILIGKFMFAILSFSAFISCLISLTLIRSAILGANFNLKKWYSLHNNTFITKQLFQLHVFRNASTLCQNWLILLKTLSVVCLYNCVQIHPHVLQIMFGEILKLR